MAVSHYNATHTDDSVHFDLEYGMLEYVDERALHLRDQEVVVSGRFEVVPVSEVGGKIVAVSTSLSQAHSAHLEQKTDDIVDQRRERFTNTDQCGHRRQEQLHSVLRRQN